MTFRWQKMADKTFMNVLAQYTVVSINIWLEKLERTFVDSVSTFACWKHSHHVDYITWMEWVKSVHNQFTPVNRFQHTALTYRLQNTIFIQNVLKKAQTTSGARGSVVVKALGYKPEGHGFETWWGEILNLPNTSGCTRPWGSLSL
jgi:recombinational DNA repair protein RecT